MKYLDDIRDVHLRPLFQQFPQLEDYHNRQDKIIYLGDDSFIRYVSAEHYDEIFKLYGKEFSDIFVDQAEKFAQEQLEFLKTINRCTSNDDIVSKTLLTFNWGDIGHSYLKRIFLEKAYESYENHADYEFIHAYGWDNFQWVRKYCDTNGITRSDYYYKWTDQKRFKTFITESDYGRNLDRLPDSQRKAQLLGDSDVFEGQFFSMFRRDKHVVKAQDFKVRKSFRVIGGLDYGQHTFLEVMSMDQEGACVVFGECYTQHLTPIERAVANADYLEDLFTRQPGIAFPVFIRCDTDMKYIDQTYSGRSKSPLIEFRRVFRDRFGSDVSLVTATKKTTDKRGYRVVINEAVKNALHIPDKGPIKFRITDECRHLTTCIATLVTDPKSKEGLDFLQGPEVFDHPYDGFKYGFGPLNAKAKEEPRRVFRVDARDC